MNTNYISDTTKREGCTQFSPHSSTHFEPKAFTLVELLVVIAIIVMLISILIPVTGKSIEKGRRVMCANNIKSLVTTTLLLANENKGYLPHLHDKNSIAPYWFDREAAESLVEDFGLTIKTFYCPSNPDWNADRYWQVNVSGGVTGSVWGYSYTANDDGWVEKSTVSIDGVSNLDRGNSFPSKSYSDPVHKTIWVDLTRKWQGDWGIGVNHMGSSDPDGYHAGYMDGHVRWINWDESNALRIRTSSIDIYFK